MTFDRLVSQSVAFGLAAMVTLATMSGIGALSVSEHAATELAAARAEAHTVQASQAVQPTRAPRS
jgi:hypothetical protein